MDQLKAFFDASANQVSLALPHGHLQTHHGDTSRTLQVDIHTFEWDDLCTALSLLPLAEWRAAGAMSAVHVPGKVGIPSTSTDLSHVLRALEHMDKEAPDDTYIEVEMMNRAGTQAEVYFLVEWSTITHSCKVSLRYEWITDAQQTMVSPVCVPMVSLEPLMAYLLTPMADWICV
jgi:hypothetical protein